MKKNDLSPVFLLALCYASGIILAGCLVLPLWLPILSILGLSILLLISLVRPFRSGRFIPYLLFVCLGFLLTLLVVISMQKSVLLRMAKAGRSAVLKGQVITEPKRDRQKTVFTFKVAGIADGKRERSVDELTRVTIIGPGRLNIENGNKLCVQGRLMLPLASSDSSFDYRKYLYRQRIQTVLMVRPEQVRIIARSAGPVIQVVNVVRKNIVKGVYRFLTGSRAGLMLGILLGDTTGISRDVQADFKATGLTHILAVSGLNVGALVLICFFVARLIRSNPVFSYLFISMVIVFYTLLTLCQPSVLRASTMALIGMGGFLLGRRRDLVSAISAAALILLIYDPFLLYNVSFQLSFGATYAIIFVTPVLDNKLEIKPEWLKTAVSVALAAQLGVAPILVYYFNQLSLISVIANVLVVPVNAPVLALGITGGVAGLVSLKLAAPVYLTADLMLSYMIDTAHVLASVPGSSLMLERPPPGMIAVYYLLVITALAFWSKRLKWQINLGALLIALLLPLVLVVWGQVGSTIINDEIRVTFLDVGQGDSTLIQTAEGQTVLIDGGEDPARLRTLLDQNGVQKIDLIVLTHPHFDHVGGLVEVVERYPVSLVLDSGQPHTSSTYLRFLETIDRKKVPYKLARWKQRFELGKVKIEVLHPPSVPITGTVSDLNNNSVVIRVTYKQVAFLFPGDIEEEGEASILSSDQVGTLKTGVLKVPHHGSLNAGGLDFFHRIKPTLAVISVGKSNRYGHPSEKTMSRLRSLGAEVYRTDERGSVTITSDGDELNLRCSREAR